MTDTVTVPEDTKTETTPKGPSKKSLALAIFNAKMAERAEKKFATNKEFRAAVLTAIRTELNVSVASAATMYNAAKKDAEAADATVGLGRDPKKEKVKNPDAKRGRPTGSTKKAKEKQEPTTVVTTEGTETTVVANVDAESVVATGETQEVAQPSVPAEAV